MLSHVRVLDLTDDQAAICGYLLAQHGAEVIRVEPPGGSALRRHAPFLADGSSAVAAAFGRGSRSVTLDLHDAADRDRFSALLREADVLVENLTRSERRALGLDPDATAALNPALVHASITAFGCDGPKADWAATDLTVMAAASPLAVTGDRDRAPVRMSAPQAFCFAGGAAAGAVLLALYERGRSGLGQHVDASAQQAAALATQAGLLASAVNAPVAVRSAGGASLGLMSLRFLYPARDGFVSITHVFGAAAGVQTARLMNWVHESGFCDQATRDKDWMRYAELVDAGEEPVAEWERVKNAVAAFTSAHTKAELLAGAVQRNLLMAPVLNLAEVLDLPHHNERGFFESVPAPGGSTLRAPGRYLRASGWAPSPLSPAPTAGADTAAVLNEASRAISLPDGGGDPSETTAGPLAGLKVLDLTWSVAGPAFLRTLADHGATVVKVESQRRLDAARAFLPFHHNVAGVDNSALFDNMNAGKRSITLNIAHPDGRAVLEDLIRWADVVVDSFSPRGRQSVGLDPQRLAQINPNVMAMSLTLFGLDGPLAVLAGFGNLGAATAGCYDIVGWADRGPAGPYLAYTDYTSAHLMVVSLMAALVARQRNGQSQFLALSQCETALQFLAPALLSTGSTGEVFTRMGNDDLDLAPHGVYPCAGEDRWVAIACQSDTAFQSICTLLERADLASDPSLQNAAGRLGQRARLDTAVTTWTSRHDPETIMNRCQAAGVAAHTVQTSADCLADPQFIARGHFVELDHPNRYCVVEATRFRLSRTPGYPRRHGPLLGEHTFEVLTDLLGYDADRVADLAVAELLE